MNSMMMRFLQVAGLMLGGWALQACCGSEPPPAARPATGTAAAAEGTGSVSQPPAPAGSGVAASPPLPTAPSPTAGARKAIPPDRRSRPVPVDWTYMMDRPRGFGFYVPSGTSERRETKNGLDILVAEVTRPQAVEVLAVAVSDQAGPPDELTRLSQQILDAMGLTAVALEPARELVPDFQLAAGQAQGREGPIRFKALLVRDGAYRYLLLVQTPAADFAAATETLDAIWGSFEVFGEATAP